MAESGPSPSPAASMREPVAEAAAPGGKGALRVSAGGAGTPTKAGAHRASLPGSPVSDSRLFKWRSGSGAEDAAGGGEPFFIGVAGGTASGKTTVCERIIHNLADHRVCLISQDSFYRGLSPEELANVKDYNFDHPDAIDVEAFVDCLVSLRDGKPVDVPTYDFSRHQRGEEVVHMHKVDVVIVEGILVLHMEDVRELCNMKVFVDTDDDVRLARRIKRDTAERGRDVNGVIEQYTRFVKPSFDKFVFPSKRDADVIIPWARGDNDVAIGLIVQHIQTKLQTSDLRRIFPNLHVMHANFQTRSMHTIIRDATTHKHDFVFYADRLIRLVVETALGYLPFSEKCIITPTGAQYVGVDFAEYICGVSIIRSGEAMENALRACCKGVRIGKILIHRNTPAEGSEGDGNAGSQNGNGHKLNELIYEKLPKDIAKRNVLLMDPILATGRSVCEAIDVIVRKGVPPKRIIFVCLIAAPEGIREVATRFPGIQLVTTEIDHGLNDDLKVVPGIGDFGSRYFGTD